MLKKNRRFTIVLTTLVVLATLAFIGPQEKYFEVARNLDIFASLFKEVNGYYVDEVDPEKLVAIGIDAMTRSLDPYTVYIPEKDIAAFRTVTTGKYAGVGIMVARIKGEISVTMVDKKYPAYEAGIKIGDKIIEVDGHPLVTMTQEEISGLLKGEIGNEVVMKVERFGEPRLLEFRIERANIKISNVPYFGMIDQTTGYIKLAEFTNDAATEVSDALDSLKKSGASSIILDLRGNPGGLLNEAIDICNVFIEKGREVVSTKGQIGEWNRSHLTPREPVDKNIPIAVLIDNSSASAAEIVAGVIQDYDRGILVGQKSFGKGLVQTTRGLPYSSQLKITTAKYYTPSGRCIQAIDYANKDENGGAGKIPDSLKVAFKTTNGRTVYDGGGIDPDFTIEEDQLPSVVLSLLEKGLIFEYATKYSYENKSISDPAEFNLSDTDYRDFLKWLEEKEFTYDTKVEKELQHIKETASEEKYYNNIKDRIEKLGETLRNEKENDFKTFKQNISRLLSSEIVARYYLEEGRIEFLLNDDPQINKALEMLQNQDEYLKMLQAKK